MGTRSTSERAKLDRQARIEGATTLLEANDDRLRKQITRLIVQIDRRKAARTSGQFGTLTKAHKRAAKEFAAALRQLQTKLASPDLADDVGLGFPLDKSDFRLWIARADKAAARKLNAKNPHRPDEAKLFAARSALRLLKDRGMSAPLTRGGKFDRLTASLYGVTPGALGVDFLHHCRLVAKADKARK